MNHLLKVLILISVLCLMTGMPSTAFSADLVIVENGVTAYTIFINDTASEEEVYAANELSTILQASTGVVFPIQSHVGLSSQSTIVLSKNIGGCVVDLNAEGFTVYTQGEDIVITSVSADHVIYGVYHFLEEYVGVSWYAQDTTIVPNLTTLSVPVMVDHQAPRFQYREVFSKDLDDHPFYLRTRLNGQLGHRAASTQSPNFALQKLRLFSILAIINKAEYQASHPEYFGGGQVKFGKPEVQAVGLQEVKDLLATFPDEPYYFLITPEDIDTFYNSEEDQILNTAGQSTGAAYYDFMKSIADGIKIEYPNITILTLAYKWHRKAAVNYIVPDNMGVIFSTIDGNFSRPLNHADNQPILDDLDTWTPQTDRIIIWDYITNFNGYLQPYPNYHVLGENLRIFAQRPEVMGVFEQGTFNTFGGEFDELRSWVLAKLMWNANQDVKELMGKFTAGYYGAASPMIDTYLASLEQSVTDNPLHLGIKLGPFVGYLNKEFLEQADALFIQAESVVSASPDHLRHVQTARIGVDYAILVNSANFAVTAPDDYQTRYARFQVNVANANMTKASQSSSIASLIASLAIERTASTPPDICVGLPEGDCIEFQDALFSLAGSAILVADPFASDGVSATMGHGTGVWGIQLPLNNLPTEGTWKVYFSARMDAGLGEPSDAAFGSGIYPGPVRNILIEELQIDAYADISIANDWDHSTTEYIWFAPKATCGIKAFYIDRIFAVRVS